MKVLLIKDVYKLGRAGEIKKVAAGFGRNYLIPKGFAIQATSGSVQQVDRIKVKASERRAALNEELRDVAEVLEGLRLTFAVKAGETGRLYGSVSDDDIIKAIEANYEVNLEKRQIETEPIRLLGTHNVPIHLTMDLVPEITVIVHREGEPPLEDEAQVVEEAIDTVEAYAAGVANVVDEPGITTLEPEVAEDSASDEDPEAADDTALDEEPEAKTTETEEA